MSVFRPRGGATAAALLLLVGCSTTHYRESADTEVYSILDAKSPLVPGMVDDVGIEPLGLPGLEGLPVSTEFFEFLGANAESEVGASVLSLEQSLKIAFTRSREYQGRKEQLYLEALALTLDRHRFAPIFSGSARAEHVWSSRDVQQFARSVDTMAGSSGDMLRRYAGVLEESGTFSRGVAAGTTNTIRERSVEGSTSFGLDVLLRGGGRLAVDLTSSFVGFLSSGGANSAGSALAASFTQPLLRGAGRKVNAEFLTQAERDVLYELRDFTRFRKTFSVRVASAYYNVLRNRDAVRNNYTGLKSFELSLERERAFQAEGLRTAADVGRLEQSKLSRDATWTRSLIRYRNALDTFKILLGFPTDAPVILAEVEMVELVERGLRTPSLGVEDALEVALVTRLDLYTEHDLLDDSERRIKVAANALMPELDVVVAGQVDSKPGNRFASLDFDRSEWSAGLLLDLPLDRKAERNNYRRALIDYELSFRNASLADDNVRLQVRDAYRSLVQAQKDYEINLSSVDLNERRVEEETLRAELGLGNIIDQVDAQNDLTNAQTALTGALVAHHIALLEFWRDIGILFIKEDGTWEGMDNV